jgi:hypothetical protein
VVMYGCVRFSDAVAWSKALNCRVEGLSEQWRDDNEGVK